MGKNIVVCSDGTWQRGGKMSTLTESDGAMLALFSNSPAARMQARPDEPAHFSN